MISEGAHDLNMWRLMLTVSSRNLYLDHLFLTMSCHEARFCRCSIITLISFLQVDLLKHGLPDPSSSVFSHTQNSNVGSEKEHKDKVSASEEYMATPIFVHAK